MLMVVFGAGASYDSVPARPPKDYPELLHRPPLANELFDDRPDFVEIISKLDKCTPIIPLLRRRHQDASVEQVLQELKAQAQGHPERYRQLAAIRYYLHIMLWNCEHTWNHQVAKGVTNYKTLLDHIERRRKPQDRVCLVTFNYDTMLEQAAPVVGINIEEIHDYIAHHNYKVIKLHGSVNWARDVDTPIEDFANRKTWDVVNELINRAPDLEISQKYCMVKTHPVAKSNRSALFPALAIPVERKLDYECPDDHLDVLRECIPQVTKLLVIGWRATEVTFLQLLAERFGPDVRTMVVAGSSVGAEEVSTKLVHAGIAGNYFVSPGGFTDFVVTPQADDFLKI